MSKIYTFKSNIKKKSPFNKTVVAIALAVSFIAGGSGGYYLYNHKFANETREQSSGSTEPESETNKPNYIGETAFDGSEEVDNRLFEYAYPSESEGYTNNKKLYETFFQICFCIGFYFNEPYCNLAGGLSSQC